jgi:hypothetical protein
MRCVVCSLLISTACGTANFEAPTEPKAEDKSSIDRQPEEPKPVVVEYRKDGAQIALALEDTKDLPECTLENARQLAWIKKTEQFFACENQTWVEVPVKGKAGANGVNGAQGERGEKGDKGEKGEAGKPPAPNEWIDPVTGERWLFTLVQLLEQLETNHATICKDGWMLPSSAEATSAMLHGMGVAGTALGFDASFSVWTKEIYADAGTGVVYGRYAVTGAGAAVTKQFASLPAQKTAVAVCIAKETP